MYTRFEIPNTEKSKENYELNYKSTLQKLGIWDNAESN